MFNAFESCQLEPNSRDFFSFSSPSGQQFRYKRLPQGFCNSPAIMSRLTAELLANLPTSSREAKLGQVATETLSSSQARHGARQQGDGNTVPSDTRDNTPLNTQQNTPQTPPRIKPMTKTPPINNSGTLGYVDDILCYSMTLEDHINLLHILFHRIKEANCRLKTSKCFIARKEVEYLGYMVGEDGWGCFLNTESPSQTGLSRPQKRSWLHI